MILAHLADLHIGAGVRWFGDLESETPFYLDRHKKVLAEALEKMKELRVTQIILAGDLLDRKHPSAKELGLAGWFLHECTKVAETHIIPGNHELLFGNMTVLQPIAELMKYVENLHWHLNLEITEEPWGKVLWAPFHDTGKISAKLETPVDYVVAHYAAKGSVFENNYQMTKGWEFNYREGEIKQWFIGDIHARQRIAANAFYSGSICQLNFGEGGSKGFDIYDTDTGKRDQVILSSGAPLLTAICKDRNKLPEFLEGALYRVYAIKELISYPFPKNVISLQLLEARTKGEQQVDNTYVAGEIDFGEPLAGLESVLNRFELPERLQPVAIDVAHKLVN
jgi:DNA repair exonuclease SbcCD nuclease subunit